MNAVATCLRSDVNHDVADTAGRALEDALAFGDAEGEDVDEDVAVVAAVKRCLAADRRDADAVAVAGDTAHDAIDEIPHTRRVELTETERIETCDRPRAHRE